MSGDDGCSGYMYFLVLREKVLDRCGNRFLELPMGTCIMVRTPNNYSSAFLFVGRQKDTRQQGK